MKHAILIALIMLSGCANMTPREKIWVGAGVAVLAVGAIAVYKADHGDTTDNHKTTQPVNCQNGLSCL